MTSYDFYQLKFFTEGEVWPFHTACRQAGLKPIFHLFWESMLLTNIYVSITPDILHQGLQGVVKYLIEWITSAFGHRVIDMCCQSLPPNHHIRTFPHGLSLLSRVSGKEHKDMCQILLALILDMHLPGGLSSSHLVQSVRVLLDFLYLAQLPSQSTDTLCQMNECLSQFHDNKSIFVDLGIRDDFDIPKFHSLTHYCTSITLFGSMDNYNTEQSERLHIDMAKDAYCTTNCKDEYPQMTTWLERCDKVHQQEEDLTRWQPRNACQGQLSKPIGAPKPQPRRLCMALNLSIKAASFDVLACRYGADLFQDTLADYIVHINYPNASTTALRKLAEDTLLPFRSVPVFNKIKFISDATSDMIDSIHVQPEHEDT